MGFWPLGANGDILFSGIRVTLNCTLYNHTHCHGWIIWPKEEIQTADDKTRKLLTKYGGFQRKEADISGTYGIYIFVTKTSVESAF